MKDYDKNKESLNLNFWDVNNLYVWAMSEKLLVGSLKWIGNTSQFSKDFIENYNKESDEGYFLKLMLNILKNYMTFTLVYLFSLKE